MTDGGADNRTSAPATRSEDRWKDHHGCWRWDGFLEYRNRFDDKQDTVLHGMLQDSGRRVIICGQRFMVSKVGLPGPAVEALPAPHAPLPRRRRGPPTPKGTPWLSCLHFHPLCLPGRLT